MRPATAIQKIEAHGVLLVFPVAGRGAPESLWNLAHPGAEMRWDWSETADGRVVELWHLRERIAQSREVVYAKWFRGRATFFSRRIFAALLATVAREGELADGLSREAVGILELLEESSPQSTKSVRAQLELQGRHNERAWTAALKSLWARLLIVGAGEVADGAFPSLAIGATSLLFEEPWRARHEPDPAGLAEIDQVLQRAPALRRELDRSREAVRPRRKP